VGGYWGGLGQLWTGVLSTSFAITHNVAYQYCHYLRKHSIGGWLIQAEVGIWATKSYYSHINNDRKRSHLITDNSISPPQQKDTCLKVRKMDYGVSHLKPRNLLCFSYCQVARLLSRALSWSILLRWLIPGSLNNLSLRATLSSTYVFSVQHAFVNDAARLWYLCSFCFLACPTLLYSVQFICPYLFTTISTRPRCYQLPHLLMKPVQSVNWCWALLYVLLVCMQNGKMIDHVVGVVAPQLEKKIAQYSQIE